MQVLKQLPRAFYNVTVLRGRRRVTRLVVMVALSIAAFMIVRHGKCALNSEGCYGDRAEQNTMGLSREHRNGDVSAHGH